MIEQRFWRAMKLERNDLINKKKKEKNRKRMKTVWLLQETLETQPCIKGSKISSQTSIKMQQWTILFLTFQWLSNSHLMLAVWSLELNTGNCPALEMKTQSQDASDCTKHTSLSDVAKWRTIHQTLQKQKLEEDIKSAEIITAFLLGFYLPSTICGPNNTGNA